MNFVVFTELALTTFFPRWYMTDQAEVDHWFEREMPNAATRPLFEKAAQARIGFYLGYAELTPDGHHFNTAILVDRDGSDRRQVPQGASAGPRRVRHRARVPAPGEALFRAGRSRLSGVAHHGRHLRHGVCNDRRWPETYRVMGLQGVEMVVLGYNTPSVNSQKAEEGPEKRLFHHNLSVQAGAYQNSTFVVATAKCGVEDGHPLFGGSCIVNPGRRDHRRARTPMTTSWWSPTVDLDDTRFNKETIFDFERHRRIEHYGRITSQTGVTLPPE